MLTPRARPSRGGSLRLRRSGDGRSRPELGPTASPCPGLARTTCRILRLRHSRAGSPRARGGAPRPRSGRGRACRHRLSRGATRGPRFAPVVPRGRLSVFTQAAANAAGYRRSDWRRLHGGRSRSGEKFGRDSQLARSAHVIADAPRRQKHSTSSKPASRSAPSSTSSGK
jgi:hypothetical protein